MTRLYLTLSLFFFASEVCWAVSPWALPNQQVAISYAAAWTNFNQLKLFDGSQRTESDVRLVANVLGIEYGATESLTLGATLSHALVTRDNALNANTQKLGDGTASINYQLWDESAGQPVSLAVAFELKTPLSNYNPNRLSALGDGQTDVTLLTSLGKKWSPGSLTLYGRWDIGFRIRTEDPANEWISFLELGASLPSGLSFRTFLQYVDSLSGIGLESPEFFALQTATGNAPFPRLEEDWMKLGFGVSYPLLDQFVVGTAFSFVAIYRKNTSLDRNLELYLTVIL